MYVSPCTVLYSISPHTMHWAKHKINKILTQKLCFKRIQENCEQKARTRWNLNCFLISCTPSHQKKSRVPECYFISLQSDSLDKSVSSYFCRLDFKGTTNVFLCHWKLNHFRAPVIQFCAKHRKTVGAKRGK